MKHYLSHFDENPDLSEAEFDRNSIQHIEETNEAKLDILEARKSLP